MGCAWAAPAFAQTDQLGLGPEGSIHFPLGCEEALLSVQDPAWGGCEAAGAAVCAVLTVMPEGSALYL